jgi:hypothetical protein
LPRSCGRSRVAGSRRIASGPIVLVLPGYERFVSGLGGGSLEHVAVGRFPNGELHVEVPARLEGRSCIVVGSISPPAGNLERLTLVAHASAISSCRSRQEAWSCSRTAAAQAATAPATDRSHGRSTSVGSRPAA